MCKLPNYDLLINSIRLILENTFIPKTEPKDLCENRENPFCRFICKFNFLTFDL